MPEQSLPKEQWGDGPWQDEPDHLAWTDPATGYPCLAHRVMSHGAWCGYVAVPPGHPAHGQGYDALAVDVHGGLTYAARCQGDICHVPAPGEPDDVFWLGWDTVHAGDYSPAIKALLRQVGYQAPFTGGYEEVYRTLAYVQAQNARLAAQLKAMEA